MNSLLNLGRCLGDVSTSAFRRHHQYQAVQSLEHDDNITFSYASPDAQSTSTRDGALKSGADPKSHLHGIAHQAGTNCLTIDPQTGHYLVTGGADSTVRLWDIEQFESPLDATSNRNINHKPFATLSRSQPLAHTHAITSLSIYPFDPQPTTLLTTSYDKSLLLSSITPTSIQPVHKTSLEFTPHTHAISPHASFSSPLVAIGTTHPAIRLLDLRTGLATHSLPGHNGSIYALSFHPSPSLPHLLISGGVDGRILLFDIRRANPAFASLDLEDAIGFPNSPFDSPDSKASRPSHLHLNYSAQAHTGPVTGLVPVPSPLPSSLSSGNGGGESSGSHLVSTGHDNRIRVWDLNTGANSLVHFGPRIRNSRTGNFSPLVLPASFAPKAGRDMLLWPNDDTRGEIFVHDIHEGTLLSVLKTKGIDRSNTAKKGQTLPPPPPPSSSSSYKSGGRPTSSSNINPNARAKAASKVNIAKVTNRGRINQLALRYQGEGTTSSEILEIYSAHGDGSISVWKPSHPFDQDAEVHHGSNDEDDDDDDGELLDVNAIGGQGHDDRVGGSKRTMTMMTMHEESNKKRKRDLIGDLVSGLTRK